MPRRKKNETTYAWLFLPTTRILPFYTDGINIGDEIHWKRVDAYSHENDTDPYPFEARLSGATILESLQYAPGPILCQVQLIGDVQQHGVYKTAPVYLIQEMYDFTNELSLFINRCVLELSGVWNCPTTVWNLLNGIGECNKDVIETALDECEMQETHTAVEELTKMATKEALVFFDDRDQTEEKELTNYTIWAHSISQTTAKVIYSLGDNKYPENRYENWLAQLVDNAESPEEIVIGETPKDDDSDEEDFDEEDFDEDSDDEDSDDEDFDDEDFDDEEEAA